MDSGLRYVKIKMRMILLYSDFGHLMHMTILDHINFPTFGIVLRS